MLTIDIRVNGRLIGHAKLINQSNLSEISDYSLEWSEVGDVTLGIEAGIGSVRIEGHRRRQTVWALVAKAAAAILGQKIEAMEGKR